MKSRYLCAIVAVVGCAFAEPLPVDPVPSSESATCPKLRPINRTGEKYPRDAILNRQQGWVIVGFDLPVDGVPRNVHVVASSPKGIFEAVSVTAVEQSRFNVTTSYEGCLTDFIFRLKE